jgi:hypothetical protein
MNILAPKIGDPKQKIVIFLDGLTYWEKLVFGMPFVYMNRGWAK